MKSLILIVTFFLPVFANAQKLTLTCEGQSGKMTTTLKSENCSRITMKGNSNIVGSLVCQTQTVVNVLSVDVIVNQQKNSALSEVSRTETISTGRVDVPYVDGGGAVSLSNVICTLTQVK